MMELQCRNLAFQTLTLIPPVPVPLLDKTTTSCLKIHPHQLIVPSRDVPACRPTILVPNSDTESESEAAGPPPSRALLPSTPGLATRPSATRYKAYSPAPPTIDRPRFGYQTTDKVHAPKRPPVQAASSDDDNPPPRWTSRANHSPEPPNPPQALEQLSRSDMQVVMKWALDVAEELMCDQQAAAEPSPQARRQSCHDPLVGNVTTGYQAGPVHHHVSASGSRQTSAPHVPVRGAKHPPSPVGSIYEDAEALNAAELVAAGKPLVSALICIYARCSSFTLRMSARYPACRIPWIHGRKFPRFRHCR